MSPDNSSTQGVDFVMVLINTIFISIFDAIYFNIYHTYIQLHFFFNTFDIFFTRQLKKTFNKEKQNQTNTLYTWPWHLSTEIWNEILSTKLTWNIKWKGMCKAIHWSCYHGYLHCHTCSQGKKSFTSKHLNKQNTIGASNYESSSISL